MEIRGDFKICTLILIYILFSSNAALIDECPDPHDVYPCYCEEEDGSSVMHCNYLNESKQIRQAHNKISNFKIYKVSIFRNEIKPIKSDAFKGPAVSQIDFTNSTIFMEQPQFVGLESSLIRLTFLSCFDEENPMNIWSFSHLEKLKDISFHRNHVKTLKNSWLISTGPSLRSITFSECRIQRIEDKAFQKVEKLATLFLNDNEIPSILRSMFPSDAEYMRTINLNNNKLQDLPDDIFEDMPSLNSLELQNNLLKTLSETTWSSMIQRLSRLYLDDNPIRCDRDLKWISMTRLPNTFTGKCQAPLKLKNKNLNILMPADFH